MFPGYVLTARHCVPSDVRSLYVVLGEYDVSQDDGHERMANVSRIIRHPDYDVSLLRLECQPGYNRFIQPIDLARSVPAAGESLQTSGWGSTVSGPVSTMSDVLQKLSLPLSDDRYCDHLDMEFHELCIGSESDHYKNVCHGDSGSPVTYEDRNGDVTQVAVITRGERGCPPTAHYAITVSVRFLRYWIGDNANTDVDSCDPTTTAPPTTTPPPTTTTEEPANNNGGGGGGGIWCFPKNAHVQLENNETISVASLTHGDRILAMSSSGAPVYSEFISFLHMDSTQVATFLAIHTDTHTVQISQKHLLYIQDKTNSKGFYDFAKNIKVGQYVLTAAIEGGFVASRVNGVESFVNAGVYAPLTAEGTVVVDGVVASCYAEVKSHNLAHMAIWPYRMWKQYVDSASYTTQEMPTYVKFLQTFVLPSVGSN